MVNENMTIEEQQKLVLRLIKEVDKICIKHDLRYTLGFGSVLGAVRHKGFIPWDSDMDIIIPVTSEDSFRKAFDADLPEDMCIHKWGIEDNYHPCFDRIAFKDIPHELVHVDVYESCGVPDDLKKRKRFINECYYTYHILACKIKDPKYSRPRNRWKVRAIKLALSLVPKSFVINRYRSIQSRYDYDTHDNVFCITSIYRMHDYMIKKDLLDTVRVPFEDIKLPIPRKSHEYLSHLYGDYMTPRRYD